MNNGSLIVDLEAALTDAGVSPSSRHPLAARPCPEHPGCFYVQDAAPVNEGDFDGSTHYVPPVDATLATNGGRKHET